MTVGEEEKRLIEWLVRDLTIVADCLTRLIQEPDVIDQKAKEKEVEK